MKSYEFNESYEKSKFGVKQTIKYLNTLPNTISITDVQDDKEYQKKDIDLLWEVSDNNKKCIHSIEIKTDEYYNTKNFFFETISNMNKGTDGCFMVTQSDFIFYVFDKINELHILKTNETRHWFNKNKKNYTASYPSTKNKKGEILYYSKGYPVKIDDVKEAVYVQTIRLQ